MAANPLQQAIDAHTALGEEVCHHVQTFAGTLGLDLGGRPHWPATRFSETTDPYSREVSLVGTWQDGQRFGTATFFPDGRVFAEYQLLVPHPAQPAKFVESVSIWGRAGALKREANLLDMPS